MSGTVDKAAAAAAKAKGNASLQAGKFAEAIEHYTEAIKHDPTDHVFYSNRSASYLSVGDADSALVDAEQCIALNPAFAKGYSRKGGALYSLRRYDEAVHAFEDGLKRDPTNEALKSSLQDAQAALTRQQAARVRPAAAGMPPSGFTNPFGPDMMARLAANPKFAPYLADEAFAAKLRKLQTADEAGRSAALASMLGGGMGGGEGQDPRMMEVLLYLFGLNMPAEPEDDDMMGGMGPGARTTAWHAPAPAPPAEPVFTPAPAPAEEEDVDMSEEAVARRAAKAAAVAKKEEGNKLYKAKEFGAALECYRQAYALDDTDITYLLNEAAVYFEQGKYPECVDVCKKAVERGNEVMAPFALKAKAHARIGNALYKAGDLKGAIEAYDDSLLESHNDEVYDKLKKTKVELKKREEEEYKNPALAVEAKEAGNEAFKAGDFPTAVKMYTEAIKRDPSSPVYFTNRATARVKLMELLGALDDCEHALKLDPKYVKAMVRKGSIQALSKEYHKAMETLQRVLELEPENVEARDQLRRVVYKINEASESTTADPDRAARAMADPEIQNILRDPMVNAAIRDLSTDPTAAARVLSDPVMAAKLQKLIAAGVLAVK